MIIRNFLQLDTHVHLQGTEFTRMKITDGILESQDFRQNFRLARFPSNREHVLDQGFRIFITLKIFIPPIWDTVSRIPLKKTENLSWT